MPKGKKKGKYEHRRTELPCSSDEDAGIDMTNDNYSETSGQSDLKSNHDDTESVTSPRAAKTKDTSIFVRNCLPEDRQKVFDAARQTFGIRDVWIEDSTIIIRLPDGSRRDLTSMKELEHLLYWTPKEDLEVSYFDKTVLSENDAQEKQEEKVLEIMEALSARSNAARASAFVALRAALQRRAFDTLLCSHRATLADHISRTLRRGKDGERKAAAAVAPLVALQIGEEGTEEFVAEVRPALTACAVDKTASLETRTECCSSLAVLCYLMEDDVTEILEVMRVYETIFSGSYLKGDGSVKTSGSAVEEGAWHAAALEAWALLLSLLAPAHARQLLLAARLAQLLEAPALDVRVAAGPALALAHECATADDAPLEASFVDALLPLLTELARDSHKYRAKRDRKLQRATFRDVLKYFEEGEVPNASVRVGTETAAWDSWCGGAAYGALAAALGGALQPLALRSARLRQALALPDAPPPGLRPAGKLNKLQRHLQNTAACKARTLARNKNRDKRSAALAM